LILLQYHSLVVYLIRNLTQKNISVKNNSYKENGLKKESDLDLVINDFLYFLNVNMSKLLLINKIKLEDYIKVDRLLTLLWVLS